MSEEETQKEDIHKLPEAVVSTRRRQISIVWIVPLVALLIGAWLVYKTFSEKGPTITISFKSAEGLEAGGSVTLRFTHISKSETTNYRED